MSKFLDETGLTHLVSKLETRFGEMYVPRKEFDSFSTDIKSDINTAMYGPYSVSRASVSWPGTSASTKSLNLPDAMGPNSPRIYVIDMSLSSSPIASSIKTLDLTIGSSIASDIGAVSPSMAYDGDRFNNLTGGVMSIVFRVRGNYNFMTSRIAIRLNNAYWYLPQEIKTSAGEIGTTSPSKYRTLNIHNTSPDHSYVLAHFVGHGRTAVGGIAPSYAAIPTIIGCMGYVSGTVLGS